MECSTHPIHCSLLQFPATESICLSLSVYHLCAGTIFPNSRSLLQSILSIHDDPTKGLIFSHPWTDWHCHHLSITLSQLIIHCTPHEHSMYMTTLSLYPLSIHACIYLSHLCLYQSFVLFLLLVFYRFDSIVCNHPYDHIAIKQSTYFKLLQSVSQSVSVTVTIFLCILWLYISPVVILGLLDEMGSYSNDTWNQWVVSMKVVNSKMSVDRQISILPPHWCGHDWNDMASFTLSGQPASQ